jgi:hypothetical protein
VSAPGSGLCKTLAGLAQTLERLVQDRVEEDFYERRDLLVAEVERLRALTMLEILADRVGEIAERPVVWGARADQVAQLDRGTLGQRVGTRADKLDDLHPVKDRELAVGSTP